MYEYGYLTGWYIKSIIYEVLIPKLLKRKNKVGGGKTPFFAICSSCTPHSIAF